MSRLFARIADRTFRSGHVSTLLTILVLIGIAPSRAVAQVPGEGPEQGIMAVYADRLIDGGKLEPWTLAGDGETAQTAGNLRSLVVELSGSSLSPRSRSSGTTGPGLDRRQHEAGISISGRVRTVNFGELGIDAQLRSGSGTGLPGGTAKSGGLSGSMTLTARDLPLGNGWLASTALGNTSVQPADLVLRQTRFTLPSIPILGAAAKFFGFRKLAAAQPAGDPEPVASFNFSMGEPGLLGGVRLSDFSGLSGRLISAGGQIAVNSRLTAGIQTIDLGGARDPQGRHSRETGGRDDRPALSNREVVASLAYAHRGLSLQANAIWSHDRRPAAGADRGGPRNQALGAWIDTSYRNGRTRQNAGLYCFQPGLVWGTATLIGNLCGGYYRFSASSQRWRWTFNFDAARAIQGRGAKSAIVNIDVQRKLDFSTTAGLNGVVRTTNGQRAFQLLGYVDKSTRLGTLRADAGFTRGPGTSLFRAGLSQNWSLPAWFPPGSRLSTQAAFEQQRKAADPACHADCRFIGKTASFGAAMSAGLLPVDGFSLDATLAYKSSAGSSPAQNQGPVDAPGGGLSVPVEQFGRSFSATVMANLRLSPRWNLSASYTDARTGFVTGYGHAAGSLAMLSPDDDAVRRGSSRLRAGYLTLRYALSAGRPRGTIGQREFPVGGTGTIEGRIFLDGNANRRREPAEAGVAGIVVILDGSRTVRTDTAGFYRFEAVADGPHRITLNADTLPLPWTIESEAEEPDGARFASTVDVGIRSTTTLDIPASRDR